MGLTVSTVVAFIALLIAVSATYNAYLLRGGKLAWSQVLIVLGMLCLIFSLIINQFMPNITIISGLTAANLLFIVGFVLLLSASLKLRHSIR